jgi:hypothetical protein
MERLRGVQLEAMDRGETELAFRGQAERAYHAPGIPYSDSKGNEVC